MMTSDALRRQVQRHYRLAWAEKEEDIAACYGKRDFDEMTAAERKDASRQICLWHNSYGDYTPPWENENPLPLYVTRRDDARVDRAWEFVDDGRI